MGRKPSKSGAIPRLRARKQKSGIVHYYYDHGGRPRRESALGSDYGAAIQQWAQFEHARADDVAKLMTFRHVADAYRRDVMVKKAPRTQKDNAKELSKLLEFFDDPPAPLDRITPQFVRQYMNWRTKAASALVRANREKALLSHIWNYARDRGYTALTNPCAGIAGSKERGRDVYVEDEQFQAIKASAPVSVRDFMDLLYLTGQRPSDVLALDEFAIKDGVMRFRQGKTGAKVGIEIVGELAEVVERIRARKKTHDVYTSRLVVNEVGKEVKLAAWSRQFSAACKQAGVSGVQLRDLRAKAATDKAESAGDIRQAQRQLGHTTVTMTEHYTRKRRGDKVTPTR